MVANFLFSSRSVRSWAHLFRPGLIKSGCGITKVATRSKYIAASDNGALQYFIVRRLLVRAPDYLKCAYIGNRFHPLPLSPGNAKKSWFIIVFFFCFTNLNGARCFNISESLEYKSKGKITKDRGTSKHPRGVIKYLYSAVAIHQMDFYSERAGCQKSANRKIKSQWFYHWICCA